MLGDALGQLWGLGFEGFSDVGIQKYGILNCRNKGHMGPFGKLKWSSGAVVFGVPNPRLQRGSKGEASGHRSQTFQYPVTKVYLKSSHGSSYNSREV